MEKHFGDLMPTALRSCALCHVAEHAEGAGSLDEFPHNPFGDAVRVAGEALLDEGDDDSIPERFQRIADGDADSDGVSNLSEILLGSLPGDPDQRPDESSLASLQQKLGAYRRAQSGYRWKPFEPVVRPAVPDVAMPNVSTPWMRNPIDAFVAARRQSAGLKPNGEADPAHLLRRVHLDLTGLAPEPEQVERFIREYDEDPSVYDRVVDSLLEHPGYGERWGRHWMDVWRYSDWAGYRDSLRESQRHIWHWRDWIVESLNEDKGYDRMVTEMLAADELHAGPDDLRATGYLARNYFHNRDQWMDNVVKHTSQAFMGVTLGCAKCHDHMSDPFAQTEYYQLRAIFEPYHVQTDRVPGEMDLAKNGIPRAYDRTAAAKTYLFEAGDERFPVKDEVIPPGVPEVLGGSFTVATVERSHDEAHPDQRRFVVDALLRSAEQRVAAAKDDIHRAAAEKSLAALRAEIDLERQVAEGLDKNSEAWKSQANQVQRLQREAAQLDAQAALKAAQADLEKATGKWKAAQDAKDDAAVAKAKKAKAAAEKSVASAEAALKKADGAAAKELDTKFKPREQTVYPAVSSGRRLAFARWLTDRDNPLTARVAVNHIWLRHFGRGLVATPNDFGASGASPSHPALLDWLAAELMESNWSMKHVHRLIVTSATYRMASEASAQPTSDGPSMSEQFADAVDRRAVDPDNALYWRGPQRRMEGELVRDNLLHLAGRLDDRFGGPDIDQNLAQTSRRRSIYLRHAHEKLVEFVQIFDGPAVSECYQREMSIQPHQALALCNSELSVAAAEAIERELAESTGDDDAAFVDQCFLRVLNRTASDTEKSACLEFLDDGDRPRMNLILVLFNHNDFVSIR